MARHLLRFYFRIACRIRHTSSCTRSLIDKCRNLCVAFVGRTDILTHALFGMVVISSERVVSANVFVNIKGRIGQLQETFSVSISIQVGNFRLSIFILYILICISFIFYYYKYWSLKVSHKNNRLS